MNQTSVNPLGLIAGAGRFPFLVAEGARRQGRPVIAVGLRGLADPQLARTVDRLYWSGVVRLGRWIRVFRRCGVREAIMAGSVRKSEMYGRFRLIRFLPDWTSFKLWFFEVADRRNDTILRAAAECMQRRGVTLVDSVQYCREHLLPPGVLTRRQPSPAQDKDMAFGWAIAKEMGRLDIGQSIAVKEQEVIAVEAIEGTDRMIERAGQLCRHGGWMLIKVAKPDQDPRFDVPTVGPDTVANLHRHGGRALIFEAGHTLVIDRERLVEAADQLGIVVVAHEP
ncbi:MAG TPA: UDP-2,3-diacylglucosamine diphosphatase LpxI [Phycisphaerae bacterium]|nr:UDP-2,3-diacylglucosamine diphosphatase LpxI [Phycisphaerae bacterium]HRY70265.1 UDP-2,3-diacylglucosamine diphosphatase LpxI [Phycisphaerae bacterium]HSA27564.1 UDP-2,3-diacylglucosamine diphosphatase LpxI [Phycisphaerae bacterium]